MSSISITSLIDGLGIRKRLLEIATFFILSKALPADKHTLMFAEKISGKSNSLFSNLLQHVDIPTVALNRAARRRIEKLMRTRKPLCPGSPWTIALIIDATLHKRATRHTENCQKFNHGKGYVLGHQWTNLGICINGQLVPLPPIAFYTEKECKKRNLQYRSEHDKIIDFIRTLSIPGLVGEDSASEIVVLMDSGYDNNDLQDMIVKRGMNYVAALKASRSIFISKAQISNIESFFKDGRRPSKTIKLRVDSGKQWWRQYAIKQHEGHLKGVNRMVKIVCSKRSEGKMKFLACSKSDIEGKIMVALYQQRWQIEIFHRSVKSYLGMEDGGFHIFDHQHANVLWIYCAYILLCELPCKDDIGIKKRQEMVQLEVEKKRVKTIVQKTTQINGADVVKRYCLSVIQSLEDGIWATNAAFS